MAITLTDNAAKRVHKLISQQGALGLRLGLKRTGCSGMAYTFDLAQELAANDNVFEHNGATVVVSQEHLPYLDGSRLDYVREGLKEGFKFFNPKEKTSCGCGESVSFSADVLPS